MDKVPVDRLLFIFDADSGLWDAFVDSAKKVLRINGCALCQITHGLVTEKSEWRQCQEALGAPIEYLHRDEIPPDLLPLVEGELPCIVAEHDGKRTLLLASETIARCRGSVDDLRGKLLFHAAKHGLAIV
ncbi:MAG: hypothetical protein DRJ42_10895 [Deltaproteobacteria bacterium]|nr:MAG: hypothetical protein DRJ42_10895 [Deltaproteobacteria bacterium]